MRQTSAVLLLCLLGFLLVTGAQATNYEQTNIPCPPGYWWAMAWTINNSGQVLGTAGDGSTSGMFLYDRQHGTSILDLPACTQFAPQSINNAGQAAVVAWSADGAQHAYVWNAAQGFHELTAAYGFDFYAADINEHGQVVGSYRDQSYGQHVFVWDQEQGIRTIAGLDYAVAMNDNGDILGYSQGEAVLRSYSGLETAIGDTSNVNVFDLTNDGRVLCTTNDLYHSRTFVYDSATRTSTFLDLVVPGYEAATATHLNASGQVVGSFTHWVPNPDGHSATGTSKGFVWDSALGSGAVHVFDAACQDINDSGVVVGYYGQALMWTPVPEPSGLLALLCGVGCVGALRRRR